MPFSSKHMDRDPRALGHRSSIKAFDTSPSSPNWAFDVNEMDERDAVPYNIARCCGSRGNYRVRWIHQPARSYHGFRRGTRWTVSHKVPGVFNRAL